MLNLRRVEQTLFFLIILLLPTQLGRHFWPSFSFLYSLPIDYFSPTIYFWDLLVVLLIIIILLSKRFVNKQALNLFFIFLLSQSFSLIPLIGKDSSLVWIGLVRLEQYLVAGMFGVYLASKRPEELIKKIFWPLAIAVIFESSLAILQFINYGSIGFWIFGERTFSIVTSAIAKFNFEGHQFLRPYATFPHPNTLAAFLVLTLPILWMMKRDSKMAKAMMMATFLSTIIILLTVSRAALVASLSEIIYFLKKRDMFLFLVLVVILSPFLYTRFSSLINFDNLSYLRREELNTESLSIFTKSPLSGVGLNGFIISASNTLISGDDRFFQPAHNIFMLTLSETGIIGFLGLIILLAFPIFNLFRPYTINHTRYTFLLLWLIIIFLGMFDHHFLTQSQGVRVLFLIWGLSLSVVQLQYNKDDF